MLRGFKGFHPARVLLLLASPAAFAQEVVVSVTYEPLALPTANPVPALTEWGLMAMALLLAVAAYRVLRKHMGGRPLASLMLAGALGLGLASGIPLVEPARADMPASMLQISLSSNVGGLASTPVKDFDPEITFEVTNNTSLPQKIRDVQVSGEAYVLSDSGEALPRCVAGVTELAPGGKCFIEILGD